MKKYLACSFFCVLLFALTFWAGTGAHGVDSSSFEPGEVKVSAQSGGVPVGMVVAWPVALNPADSASWLECNGQTTNGYPELAAMVGANVPDLRGKFLRGLGGNSAGLGTNQGDAIRNITGQFGIDSLGASYLKGAFYRGGGANVSWSNSGGSGGGAINLFDASRVVPTAVENRPVNIAVRYLIRARP